MTELSRFLCREMEITESLRLLTELEDSFTGDCQVRHSLLLEGSFPLTDWLKIVSRGRRFIQQGDLATSENERERSSVHFFLFNDLLLIAKQQRSRFVKRWKITVRANLMDTKADAFEGKLKTSRRETLTRFLQIEVFQSLLWDRNLLFSSRLETFGISGSMTSRTSKNNFLLHLLETSWGLSCHLSLSMLSYNCTSHYLFINSQSASTLHSRDCWVVSKVNTLCGQMTREMVFSES